MTNVPVLSAEYAAWLASKFQHPATGDMLAAIRDGHHVVIERVTEAEAREAFQAWWCPPDHDENPSFFSHKAFAQDAWLAAYRALGAIKGA